MKKLLLATMASFALSLPAMAQNQDMNQGQQPSSQNEVQQQQQSPDQNQVQQQQSQDQSGLNNQQQAQNTIDPSQLNRQQVRQIQQTLNKRGFDAGHVDGRWGADTAKAVKTFQQRNQMQANGKLDQQTLQGLGVNMTAQQNRQNGVSPQQPTSATTGQGSSEDEPMQRQNPSAAPSDQSGSQMQNPSGEQNQK